MPFLARPLPFCRRLMPLHAVLLQLLVASTGSLVPAVVAHGESRRRHPEAGGSIIWEWQPALHLSA